MSSFTNRLNLIYLPKNNTWVTAREFTYDVGLEGSKDSITVPKGFKTDLASIPWPVSMFIPIVGRYNQSAVLHDYTYHIKGEITKPYNRKKRPRKECDKIFKESMQVLGVHWFKRGVMFNSVRAFGFISWRRK